MEKVDSNPHRWLWEGQDFSWWSNCRCGRKAQELELLVEPTSLAPYDSLGRGKGIVRKKGEQHLPASRYGSEKKWETSLEKATV